jgi:hypothetical protein
VEKGHKRKKPDDPANTPGINVHINTHCHAPSHSTGAASLLHTLWAHCNQQTKKSSGHTQCVHVGAGTC